MSNHYVLKDEVKSLLEGRLVKGEDILHVAHIHPGIYWQTVAVGIIALLFGTFVAHELGILLLVVTGLMAVVAFLHRRFLLFILTNKRVLARAGIIKIELVDMRLKTVESFELEQMIPGALMGYANLVVMGTGNRYIVIPYVANAAIIRKSFNEIVLEDE